MTSRKWLVTISTLCLAAAAITYPTAAHGQDFRVDTEVFENQSKEPILEQLTIFTAGGTIYDFQLTDPPEATVFDSRRGVFTLLDESRKVKATVTTQELLDYSLELETRAAQSKISLIAFCAAPKFETTEKEIQRNGQSLTELRLVAKSLTYIAEGERPQHPEAVKTYRQFADWCARLNFTRPDSLPPSARIALNTALAERDLLPLDIYRSIPASTPLGKKKEHHIQHRVNWTLSGEDQKKIDRASDMIANFQLVSYNEYSSVKVNPPAAKQARR